ncbi:hypothetical protein FOL46_003047 [Perkinsus olseni]|uniref:Uncharacterized protein n=1 Tax=Perkinsus olseni TaxID=32597 RepID=A0A7J6M4Y3_PEROL|nr:hypothetical protein FOL46_003047 [Perkinsus olseni]
MTVPSVESGNQKEAKTGATGSDTRTVHGAPSGKGPSDLLKKALSSAALSTSETSWSWYSDKLTCLQLVEYAIGAKPRCTAMSQMNFIGADGRSIGISLKALATSWGIYQHPDAPREEGLEGIRFHGKGAWRWSRFRRQLDFALNGVQGTTSPLRLLSYSLFLPRTVVGELRDLCTQHILTTGPNGEQTLNQAAELFAWKEIAEPSSDVVDTTEFLAKVKEAYSRWTTKCAELCVKAEAMMDKLECSEEASHPIVLLRRWTSLYRKAGRLDFSRIVEEEVYLAGKLSGTKGLQIDWSFRAALYEFILQQCPRAKMSDSGYGALIATVKADCKTPQELLSRLQTQALNNGEQSIDGYLGLITPEDNGRKRGPKVYDTDNGRPPKRQKFSNSVPSSQVSTRTTTTRTNDSFRLPSAELTERQRNGLCFKCGQKGHLAKNCPKTTSTRNSNKNSKDDDSTVKSIHITSASSAYSISVESVNNCGVGINPKRISNALSIVTGVISQSVGDHKYTPVRAGIDSMSSVNLISDQIVEEVSLRTSPLSQSLTVKGLNGEVELVDSCEVYLTLRSYSAQIQCLVCSSAHLPASINVLIGRPSFPKLHIQLTIPGSAVDQRAPSDQLGIHRSLSSMKRAAEIALMSGMDNDVPLPGAPEYIGRIRKIQRDDVKDHPNQKLVYEVHWTQGRTDSQKLRPSQPAKLTVYDYSVPLLQKLTEGQQQQFRNEIEDYKSHHWWEEIDGYTKPDKLTIGTACTFPVAQSIFKTTKCRPCTDCREINKHLPQASYDGYTIFEATALVRGRWDSSYTLAFLDLSKAFYRLRLGDKKYVHIVTDSHRYRSNRVVFGLVFGPAALSGLVLMILNAAFTGLLGRPVMCKSTREFTNLVPNLFCVVYYDDVMIWGDEELVVKLASILTQIAPIVGSEFPSTKQDWLRPLEGKTDIPDNSGYRHLGCIWSRARGEDGGLRLECVAPSPEEIKIANQVTRRRLFRAAGMLHDPLRLHPMTRFIADRVRRWGGSSEGGNTPEAWNHEWVIDHNTQMNLNQMLELAFKDGYGSCHHTPIDDADKIIGYCDASETGWGLLLYASSTQKTRPEEKTDRSYDRVALERLINAIHDVKDLVKEEYDIDIRTKHIKGLHNTFADELSRASSSALPLQKLSGGLETRKPRRRLYNGKKTKKGAIVLAMIDSGECTIIEDKGSSHRGVLGVASPPVDFIELPPEEAPVTLDVNVAQKQDPEEDPYKQLAGIGSLTKDDVLDHVREALADEGFTGGHSVIQGVTYLELLVALRNDGIDKPTIKAQALALGSPNGPYYRIEDGLLWVNDPQEKKQTNNAGGHKNAEYLEPFLRYWDIEAKYGLPRHVQSQGLVERVIRDLKTAIRIGSARTDTGQATVPWWLSAQVAVLAHNTSMISETVPYTPMELTIGSVSRIDGALMRTDTPSDTMWAAVNEQLVDLYAFSQFAQAEKAMIAEMKSIVDVIPRHRFKVGDQVKLSRLVDNKRQVRGPYRVQRISDSNHLIYYLEGRKDPVPLSHLLPFIDATDREQYEDAIKPAVDQLAYAAKGKAPWGEEITSATNKYWLIHSEVIQEPNNPEPITRVYISQFLKFEDDGNIRVQGLDEAPNGVFRKPKSPMNPTPASAGSSSSPTAPSAPVNGSTQTGSAQPSQPRPPLPPLNTAFAAQFLSAWSDFSSGLFVRDREKFEEYCSDVLKVAAKAGAKVPEEAYTVTHVEQAPAQVDRSTEALRLAQLRQLQQQRMVTGQQHQQTAATLQQQQREQGTARRPAPSSGASAIAQKISGCADVSTATAETLDCDQLHRFMALTVLTKRGLSIPLLNLGQRLVGTWLLADFFSKRGEVAACLLSLASEKVTSEKAAEGRTAEQEGGGEESKDEMGTKTKEEEGEGGEGKEEGGDVEMADAEEKQKPAEEKEAERSTQPSAGTSVAAGGLDAITQAALNDVLAYLKSQGMKWEKELAERFSEYLTQGDGNPFCPRYLSRDKAGPMSVLLGPADSNVDERFILIPNAKTFCQTFCYAATWAPLTDLERNLSCLVFGDASGSPGAVIAHPAFARGPNDKQPQAEGRPPQALIVACNDATGKFSQAAVLQWVAASSAAWMRFAEECRESMSWIPRELTGAILTRVLQPQPPAPAPTAAPSRPALVAQLQHMMPSTAMAMFQQQAGVALRSEPHYQHQQLPVRHQPPREAARRSRRIEDQASESEFESEASSSYSESEAESTMNTRPQSSGRPSYGRKKHNSDDEEWTG